jgi:hypothetical protein
MLTRTTPRTRAGLLAAGILLAVSAAACTGGAAPTPLPSPTAVPDSSVPASGAGQPSKEVPSMDPTMPPGEGVPPAVVQQAVDDAATRAGVDAAAVAVVSADSVTWPNGAAGCPKMGFLYTDVITPGYRVVVEAGGTTYDYRGSQRSGAVTWCENPPGPG